MVKKNDGRIRENDLKQTKFQKTKDVGLVSPFPVVVSFAACIGLQASQNFCKNRALAEPWDRAIYPSRGWIHISPWEKENHRLKMTFLEDMLVSWRVSIQHNIILFTPFVHHPRCRRRRKGLDSRGWTDRRRLNKNGEKLPFHLFRCPKSRPVPNKIQTKMEGLLLVFSFSNITNPKIRAKPFCLILWGRISPKKR